MLKIHGLKKKFGNFEALRGLDMEVEEGALYGFVGPNGAGKTTAIKIMAGLLKPDEGSVEICGKDALRFREEAKDQFGYVPDEFGMYDNLKVREYMEFFASCYGLSGLMGRKRCEELLDQVKLSDRADFFVDSLSRGMKQRLCLARALIHDPGLLILDEPTSGMDPRTRMEFKEMLKELCAEGKTILVSSHIQGPDHRHPGRGHHRQFPRKPAGRGRAFIQPHGGGDPSQRIHQRAGRPGKYLYADHKP